MAPQALRCSGSKYCEKAHGSELKVNSVPRWLDAVHRAPRYERIMTGAMRILLVEDERKVASFIARALRENTYAVDVAESGQKALELGGDVPYDAILLDVRLPDLCGSEVCRQLRPRGIESHALLLRARGLVR